jgi:hypothetical protein
MRIAALTRKRSPKLPYCVAITAPSASCRCRRALLIEIGASPRPANKGQPEIVQEIIAKRIIDIAETGERDPDKMCERVLLTFGLSA